MSYEFTYNNDSSNRDNDNIASVPEYWQFASEALDRALPLSLVFVGGGTVIQDPISGRIGIDTIDKPRNLSKGDTVDVADIGMMRVLLDEETSGQKEGLDGFIVDLRYRETLYRRKLGFCAVEGEEDIYESRKTDSTYKTREALAVIIFDSFAEELHLRTLPQYRELLSRHAIDLMTHVDNYRREQQYPVINDESQKTLPKKAIENTSTSPSNEL
jgi:hypothetical protein